MQYDVWWMPKHTREPKVKIEPPIQKQIEKREDGSSLKTGKGSGSPRSGLGLPDDPPLVDVPKTSGLSSHSDLVTNAKLVIIHL